MTTHLDSIFFTGLDSLSCRLASLLRCPLSTAPVRVPSPTALELLLSDQLSSRVPFHFRSRRDFKSKPPCLVSRQNKVIVCLAGHLHSVTCVYMCVCVCVCVFGEYFFTNAYFIEPYRHLLSTHFCICSFQLPHWFYGIRRELVNKTPITCCYPSTFCPVLGHHQGCVYCKSGVTFVCTLLLCKCLLLILVCCVAFHLFL